MDDDARISARHKALEAVLNERQRRLHAAVEAKVLGHGGVKRVHAATGVARGSILAGLKELEAAAIQPVSSEAVGRVRRAGAGRKKLAQHDPLLLQTLERLIEPTTRGDHPDRGAQFEYINDTVSAALNAGQPVICVDTKKKELLGQYKNVGKEWRPEGQPEQVKVHDFIDPQLGRANPYGVYDLGSNSAWVSVGTDHDTSSFAVATIRRWWQSMGQALYPSAKELTITADGAGSNGSRVRLWKLELQHLADELAMPIRVLHFPPGTSKWNKIEHRLFSYISMNRDCPLEEIAAYGRQYGEHNWA